MIKPIDRTLVLRYQHLRRNMKKHFILATAGHVDHGKSALVKALTGTDPDRLPEEKKRQITIDLGFAELNLAGPDEQDLQVGIVDVPGHEDFVKKHDCRCRLDRSRAFGCGR